MKCGVSRQRCDSFARGGYAWVEYRVSAEKELLCRALRQPQLQDNTMQRYTNAPVAGWLGWKPSPDGRHIRFYHQDGTSVLYDKSTDTVVG